MIAWQKKTKFKYGNSQAGGSKLEEAVYQILLLRERAQEIRDVKRQQTVVLQDGPREERISWRVDFSFVDCKSDALCFAEAKGFQTYDWEIKLKLFRARPKGRLEIWKGNFRNPKCVEVIELKERTE